MALSILTSLSYPPLYPCHIRSYISVISVLISLSYPSLHPCHIRPYIPVISVLTSLSYPSLYLSYPSLHHSTGLMNIGSAAGEVWKCSVEPEGRTGSNHAHQAVTLSITL